MATEPVGLDTPPEQLLARASGHRQVARAARDATAVSGLTHDFYRYPARFSPQFAGQAIEAFSTPGDLVLDPYMGGGTVVVEAASRGRDVVGNDINELSHFLASVKTMVLSPGDRADIEQWATCVVPTLRTNNFCAAADALLECDRAYNLSVPRARFLKRVIAAAIVSLTHLAGEQAQAFARCAILNTAQWALDGRRRDTSVKEFRERLGANVQRMLEGSRKYAEALSRGRAPHITLSTRDAVNLAEIDIFRTRRARLCVTSPPYPGVHVLYHRWQVDGRRESPAPYWIANRADGQGASYYSFASRTNVEGYFESSLRTLLATRSVMEQGGVIAQLIAFTNPRAQLRRYLQNMEEAGFSEIRESRARTWRGVPNRKWHATVQGHTTSSREVLLLHEAV